MLEKTIRIVLTVLLALSAWGPASAQAQQKPPVDCDRHCLLQFLTDYTEALTDNDRSHLKIAPGAKMTANGQAMTLGESDVWGHAKRIAFRQAFVDPETGSAVFFGTITNTPTRDAARWWFYVVRLKVAQQQITEVEEITFDGTLGGVPASSLVRADRIWDAVVPPDERVDRDHLFELGDRYFSAVSHQVPYRSVPWHPECQRVELGAFTVNSEMQPGSCGGEFKNERMKWIVVDRRFYVADVERGIVLAMGNFTAPPDYPENNPSVVMEVFKIQDGMIRYVEAFFRGNGQPHSGWEDASAEARRGSGN